MSSALQSYLRQCWEHPKRIVLWATVFTVLLSVFSFGQLSFSADRESLFKASHEEKERQDEFQQRFGSWKDLVIVVEGGLRAERETLVEHLRPFLEELESAHEVRAKIELPGVEHIGLYFLSAEELRDVDQALVNHQNALRLMSAKGWYGFLEFLGGQEDLDSSDDRREHFAKIWEQSVKGRGRGAIDHLFPRADLPENSYYVDSGKRHLLFCKSKDPIALKESLRTEIESQHFPGRVILTGQPLLQAEERRDTIRDAILSTVLSIVVVQFMLVYGFRETARPRLAFLSLGFGLFWSVAWAALAVGELNIITINFLSITVGLGVDFSIHILARYSEEKGHFPDSVSAMRKTLETTGKENLVGALATSLAFWALVMTDFLAVQQLGLVTGVAVPLCFLSVVALLPPLLFWREQSRQSDSAEFQFSSPGALLQLERHLRAHPRNWLLVLSLAVVLCLLIGSRVRFDYNLLNMQSQKSEAVLFEKQSGFNSLAAFVVAESPEQARELRPKLESLESVAEVHSVAELLPSGVQEKRHLVSSIVEKAKGLPLPSFEKEKEPNWERLKSLTKSLQTGSGEDPDWLKYLKKSGPGPVEDVWTQMQDQLRSDLQHFLGRLQNQKTNLDLQEWKADNESLMRLSNLDGKTLMRVQAKGNLWERHVLVRFVDEIETVTDLGMGPPFLIRGYLEQLRRSYFEAVRYAVIAIVILLLLHFRSLLPTLIALVPKVVGALGMFCAMSLCGINLNPANCMALPLTLGIGLVFGIHAVHRLMESPDTLLVEGATGRAIALSAWTTIASFGTLMTASHPGIFSLGFVMASGVAANMLATYLFVPPLIVLFRERLGSPR